ncbi:hypothetical protein [Nannocystis exedens]|uniref:hypothetical protein n=1 Tax=Nannocystis exedens TaxID=54 RepID=UPI0011602F37|nr:hypothetical protein [Nannocystis exedens]
MLSTVSAPTTMIRPALSTATPNATSRSLATPSRVYVHAIEATGSSLLPVVVGSAFVPVDGPVDDSPPPSVLMPGDVGPQAATRTRHTSDTRALNMWA